MKVPALRKLLGIPTNPGNVNAWEREIVRRGLAEEVSQKNSTRHLRLRSANDMSPSPVAKANSGNIQCVCISSICFFLLFGSRYY